MKIRTTINIAVSAVIDLLSLPIFYASSMLPKLGITKPIYNLKARNDLHWFEVDKHLKLAVFWKNIPIGCGPAVCVFIKNKEVLKFDCFGPAKGHFHITTVHPWKSDSQRRETRIYFMEQSIAEQIERTIFELDKNVHYYLQRHPDPRIRYYNFSIADYRKAVNQAKQLMIEFSETLPAIQFNEANEMNIS